MSYEKSPMTIHSGDHQFSEDRIERGSDDERPQSGCGCQPRTKHRKREEQEEQQAPFDHVAAGVGPDGTAIESGSASSTSLATLLLSNGARIDFAAVEEDDGHDGITMRELGDAERIMPSTLAAMSNRTALEIYTALCPKAPVPRRMAALANPKSKAKVADAFDLVDAIGEPQEVDLDEIAALSSIQLSTSSGGGWGGQFCVPGDGWHAFKDFACNGSYPANAWTWCDPSVAYYWRDRWTTGNYKRKKSFGITSTCGGPAETIHYRRRNNGNWKEEASWFLPNNHWQWTRVESNVWNRNRWVRHRSSIQGTPSFVRSYTAIYT